MAICTESLVKVKSNTHMKIRFQYKLRTLLIIVFLVACFLGWFMPIVRKAQRQRQAISVIKSHGGGIQYECSDEETWCGDSYDHKEKWGTWRGWLDDMSHDVTYVSCWFRYSQDVSDAIEHLPHVKHLAIGSSGLTGKDLGVLSSILHLESLVMQEASSLSDDDYRMIGPLLKLKRLNLVDNRITDNGLDFLGGLPKLEELILKKTNIHGLGLCHLVSNNKLRKLWLIECPLNEEGMITLGKTSQLEELIIINCKLPHNSLAQLDGLLRLEKLTLANTGLSGDCLSSLPSLPHLKELVLSEPSLDGAALSYLPQLPALETLVLHGSPVVESDVKLFREKGVEVCLDCRKKKGRKREEKGDSHQNQGK